MQTVLRPSKGERGGTAGHEAATPSRCTTTLYELLAALQDVVGPDNDALVVATVVHLLRSGRLTWRGQTRVLLGPARRGAMGTRQRVSPPATSERSRATGQREERRRSALHTCSHE